MSNLIVRHCPASWGDDDIKNAFAAYGSIVSAIIIKDQSTGASKGFGFVNFDNPISAQQAIQGMNGHTVERKRLEVRLKEAKGPPVRHVPGIPYKYIRVVHDVENCLISRGELKRTPGQLLYVLHSCMLRQVAMRPCIYGRG